MMSWETILAFSVVSFAIAISPGASWAYVIAMTISHKRLGGFCAAVGNAIGIFLHTLLAFLGLAIFVQTVPQLFTTLKLVGALYIIYIGFKNIYSTTSLSIHARKAGYHIVVLDGVMMNLLNPKVSILMLTLLPQFTDIRSHPLHILFLGGIHIAIASCVLTFIVFATEVLSKNVQNYSIFSRISGSALCCFGIYLLCFL